MPAACFCNYILLEHSRAHSLMFCLWTLSQHSKSSLTETFVTKLKMFTTWYLTKKLVHPWFKPIRLTSFFNWLRDGQKKPRHKQSIMLFPQGYSDYFHLVQEETQNSCWVLGRREKPPLVLDKRTCTREAQCAL